MLDTEISIKYMFTGYVVIFTIMVVYLISLFLRFRHLRKEMQMLEELQEKM